MKRIPRHFWWQAQALARPEEPSRLGSMRPHGALATSCLLAGAALVGCSAPVAGDATEVNGVVTQGVVRVSARST